MQDPIDDSFDLDDLDAPEPTSEVRTLDVSTRRLVVETGLQGDAAEAAWLTVTDEAGAIFFEGNPGPDGSAKVSFIGAPHVRTARVILETSRGHRQAVVVLQDGWTTHVFAG